MGQAAGRDQAGDETAKDREEMETELIWKGRRMSGERDGWTGGDRQTYRHGPGSKDKTNHPLVVQMVKNPPAMRETRVRSLGWEDSPGEGKWQPTPVFLPGESHGRRSLVGCGPW